MAPRRVLHLDVLRAVAILLVLGAHAPETLPTGAWGHAFLETWRRCGWAGVDLFFALSGYLIVGLLLDERHRTGTVDVRAFAWRRFFKIYPPYILLLTAAITWSVYSGTTAGFGATVAAFWPAAAHLQNYVPVPVAPHLWSLAMEEHCYALLLGLVLFTGRRADPLRSRAIPVALLTLFGISWLGRWGYALWAYSGTGPIGFTYTHNRIDAVLAGSLVAWMVRGSRAGVSMVWVRRRPAVLAAAGMCLVPTLMLDIYSHRPLFFLGVLPLQALGFGLLLLGLSTHGSMDPDAAPSNRRPMWLLRAFAFVGISSYSTYLWHWPFAAVLARALHSDPLDAHPAGALFRMALFIVIALGLGAVSFALIEKPALAWRQRWLATRRSVGPATVAGGAARNGSSRAAPAAGT